MRESEKHQAEIDDECKAIEVENKLGLAKSATKLLTLLGLKSQAEENEKHGDGPRTRGRPRIKKD